MYTHEQDMGCMRMSERRDLATEMTRRRFPSLTSGP
jgi:hypothetical protein